MKYALIPPYFFISPTGGVQFQAKMWKTGLEKLGHQVDLLGGSWDGAPLGEYDVVILFGSTQLGFNRFMEGIWRANRNFVIAPILDPRSPAFVYKLLSKYFGLPNHCGLTSRYHDMWLGRKYPKLWLIRSEQERHYVNYCLEIPQENIAKVPLHYRIPSCEGFPDKENFCLHVSGLRTKNKNVPRLIEAAKKYGFQLKLAGHLYKDGLDWLKDQIGDAKNIEYLGMLSEEELCNAYRRAKVFALPSTQEGVGMVALEAAAYGCEIVLTNYGAPKEYFNGKAILVNPRSVDEIGKGVVKALRVGYGQPSLKAYIEKNFSEEACCKLLHETICKHLKI